MNARLLARFALIALAGAATLLTGCRRPAPAGYQGYLECDFVYVAAPLAGRLDTLAVEKGRTVAAGDALFTLEHAAETATRNEAAERLRQAQAHLADLSKGSRPTELDALEARLAQARSTAELSRIELERQDALFRQHAIPASELDRARFTHERNTGAVNDLLAQLATARLGARTDALTAAEAEVAAAQAALTRAEWSVAQKSPAAPRAGLVYDTLYRPGEFVAASSPVVALLPRDAMKVRFFVPEADVARIALGAVVNFTFTAHPAAVRATVNYVSPAPEYTPPVLYNRDNRAKLVFMVEALVAPADAAGLHPGQPVDVTLTGR
jgi:HlyD family secretion protein